jgi:putative Mn2+ efflux pump MntP
MGHRLGERFGERMEIVGRLILISIGLRILMTRLLG